jgi:hypothetical protein
VTEAGRRHKRNLLIIRSPGVLLGARYTERGKEKNWLIPGIFDQFVKNKPHLILCIASDCSSDERLVKYEWIALISHMLARMRSNSYKKHLVFPVRYQPIIIVSQAWRNADIDTIDTCCLSTKSSATSNSSRSF